MLRAIVRLLRFFGIAIDVHGIASVLGMSTFISAMTGGLAVWAGEVPHLIALSAVAAFALSMAGFYYGNGIHRDRAIFQQLHQSALSLVRLAKGADGSTSTGLQLSLMNYSNRGIFCQIDRALMTLDGRGNFDKQTTDVVAQIPARSEGAILLGTIEGLDFNKRQLSGSLFYCIRYGPADDQLRYAHELDCDVTVLLEPISKGQFRFAVSALTKRSAHKIAVK